jgi:hypothetical protein
VFAITLIYESKRYLFLVRDVEDDFEAMMQVRGSN